MFFQCKGLDHDYNEFKCLFSEQFDGSKTIYNYYRYACDQVLLCVCSAFVFNATKFGGSTRQRLQWSHKVCSHLIPESFVIHTLYFLASSSSPS